MLLKEFTPSYVATRHESIHRKPIRGSAQVAEIARVWFQDDRPQERFYVILLDAKHVYIGHEMVSQGTLDATMAHPRDIFRLAVHQSAAAIILVHNHPTGDPTASEEDTALTRRLRTAGEVLDIEVLDHVIIANNNDKYYSLRDAGVL